MTFTAAERPREEHLEWRDTWGRISRKYHSEKAESEKMTLKKSFPSSCNQLLGMATVSMRQTRMAEWEAAITEKAKFRKGEEILLKFRMKETKLNYFPTLFPQLKQGLLACNGTDWIG